MCKYLRMNFNKIATAVNRQMHVGAIKAKLGTQQYQI